MTSNPRERRPPIAFVGGPIQHVLLGMNFHPVVRRLIESVHAELESAGVEVLSAHVEERFGLMTPGLVPNTVAIRDFEWMRRCDVFVAVLPVMPDGSPYRTDGTHVELGWASALGKPVVLVTRLSSMPRLSHLVRGLDRLTPLHVYDTSILVTEPGAMARTVQDLCSRKPAPAATPAISIESAIGSNE